MSNTYTATGYAAPSRLAAFFRAFTFEAAAMAEALLHPGKLVGEVQQFRDLHLEASRVEGRDPTRAEALRRQASRLCIG